MRIPRGVASTDLDLAAVQDAAGRLQAIDLRSGESLGTSERAATPLLVAAQRIFGYRLATPGALEVFAARAAGGALHEIWSTRVPIARWVGEPASDRDGLAVEARLEGSELLVTWRARSRYRGGAPPPQEVEQAARRDAGGTVHLAADDGRVVSEQGREPDTEEDRAEAAVPAPPPGRTVVAYRDGTGLATQAWQTPGGKTFLSRPAGGGGMSLMRESEKGAELVRDLSSAAGAEATLTAGGRLVFVREGGDPDAPWRVFSAEDAELVTTLPFDPGTVELTSEGDLVFALVHEDRDGRQGLVLRCRSLRDGALIWSHALGERERPMPRPFPR